MMKTKYIPQSNADYILKVLQIIKKNKPAVNFVLIDSVEGDVIYKGNDPEKAVEEMDGIDSDFGLNCYGENDQYLGWFFFTPYEEEGCVLCDYSDNEFCMGTADESIA